MIHHATLLSPGWLEPCNYCYHQNATVCAITGDTDTRHGAAVLCDDCLDKQPKSPDYNLYSRGVLPAFPLPGDAVRLTGAWPSTSVKPGAIGIIDGIVGEYRADYLIVFNPSPCAFRGTNGGKYDKSGIVIVSTSGGPAPYVPASELTPTGETVDVRFWRWQDLPRAGGGTYYRLTVPLWEWNYRRSQWL